MAALTGSSIDFNTNEPRRNSDQKNYTEKKKGELCEWQKKFICHTFKIKMSLISTYLNKYGIVLASDSNLSIGDGNAGFGQKVFAIPHLNAGLAYSGSYTIDGDSVDKWVTSFITGSYHTTTTIEEFGTQLRQELNGQMREYEFNHVTIIHICGYQVENHNSYLQHWHLSNSGLNKETGLYDPTKQEFHLLNDFNTQTNQVQNDFLSALHENSQNHQFFINGFPEGRIAANYIKQTLGQVFNHIWNQATWHFNPPSNLFETANVLKTYYTVVKELFKMSDHAALYVGGETQTHLIPAPQNLYIGHV